MTYDFGDQKVTCTGDSAAISLENHQYHVSWTVYMVNNSGLKKMSLLNVSYSFINSAAQHSAVLKANNSLGTSYGPWYAPEFANSYTFPIYFSVFSVQATNDNIPQSNPAIMELTYSVQMGITLNHIGLFSGPSLNLPFYLAYYDLTST